MKPVLLNFVVVPALLLACPRASAQVERVWLTHRSHDPSRLVVNWTTELPGDSRVRFGRTSDYGREVLVPGRRTLHHVEIPLSEAGGLHYSVSSGDQTSQDATFRGYPEDVLRVAVVANWHAKPDLRALMKDDVQLLLSAGDNVPDLFSACGAGVKDCVKPYAALIDAYPGLFRSVPFMPASGNHDRQIRPRGEAPPEVQVYDLDATAFRRFFPLPGDGPWWHFDVPDFGVRFVALDLHHVSDRGTTWQSCSDFGTDSDQYRWYKRRMEEHRGGFHVTLYNERNATVRGLEKGAWGELIRKGTLAISGFGHFAERAESGGVTYINTSLAGRGDKYPDSASKFLRGEDNYLLMKFEKKAGTLTVELKNLKGEVLDRVTIRVERK